MRRILMTAAALLVIAGVARADCEKVAVSGGYEYNRVVTTLSVERGSGTSSNLTNMNGWYAEGDYNANCWLGGEALFTGLYATPVPGFTVHDYNYLFGPRVMVHNPTPVTPFVEGLFGGTHLTANDGFSQNKFAAAFGGGVDVRVASHVAIRGRVDYVFLNTSAETSLGENLNNISIGAGIVVKF